MSAIFLLNRDGEPDYETSTVPRAVFLWVVDVLAERVRDEELATALREFHDGRYAWMALNSYTPDQGAEIVRVIRTELKALAEQESASTGNTKWLWMIDEVVAMAERWHVRA